ncbi:hypothetical protein K402DRAFT_446032 [Aulographum hederae CBS 113979]|uniref:Uncharacterized protein n=1 Tax=Aulographum hederae CBS 113979 TaxID=1176131 RepID=A0A6G1H2G3_9PEZI|nr:hypothetical protein K402DRAFT_446032 [Aulographum hederae CBS 113979]
MLWIDDNLSTRRDIGFSLVYLFGAGLGTMAKSIFRTAPTPYFPQLNVKSAFLFPRPNSLQSLPYNIPHLSHLYISTQFSHYTPSLVLCSFAVQEAKLQPQSIWTVDPRLGLNEGISELTFAPTGSRPRYLSQDLLSRLCPGSMRHLVTFEPPLCLVGAASRNSQEQATASL